MLRTHNPLLVVRFLLALILFYQRHISLDTGKDITERVYCHHEPRCSEYSKQALLKYGLFRGIYLTVRRLLRCHPWSSGGVDLP